jgi:hypothetical protein
MLQPNSILCTAMMPTQLLAELDRASACSCWLSSGTGVANRAASGATFGGTSVCTSIHHESTLEKCTTCNMVFQAPQPSVKQRCGAVLNSARLVHVRDVDAISETIH